MRVFVLEDDRINKDSIVIIHSYNPDGAKAMRAELEGVAFQTIIAPFGTKQFLTAIELAEQGAAFEDISDD